MLTFSSPVCLTLSSSVCLTLSSSVRLSWQHPWDAPYVPVVKVQLGPAGPANPVNIAWLDNQTAFDFSAGLRGSIVCVLQQPMNAIVIDGACKSDVHRGQLLVVGCALCSAPAELMISLDTTL